MVHGVACPCDLDGSSGERITDMQALVDLDPGGVGVMRMLQGIAIKSGDWTSLSLFISSLVSTVAMSGCPVSMACDVWF